MALQINSIYMIYAQVRSLGVELVSRHQLECSGFIPYYIYYCKHTSDQSRSNVAGTKQSYISGNNNLQVIEV